MEDKIIKVGLYGPSIRQYPLLQYFYQQILMGNSKSSQQNTQTANVNHPYFGQVQIVTHNDEKYLKIKMLVDSQKTIKRWEDQQDLVKDIDDEPLLLPVDHQFVKQGMCGTTGVLQILYPNHPVILKDQIQNRRETQQIFEQSQIWYLLHVLISSAAEFHKRERKVGDIRPGNIFINEDGQVKLANVCSWPRDQNNYFKSLNDKQETYLSPEEMSELQNNVAIPDIDPVKGESFSIGLTLLDAVCLEDCSKLYNFKNCTFDTSKLQTLIVKLNAQSFYSAFLKEIIMELLEMDPNIRKSPQQIYQKILPYEYNIKNLIAFTPIRNIPQITGTKSVVSTYHNPTSVVSYPRYDSLASQPQTYTQSVYETRNTIPPPPSTLTNLPVTNNRIAYPVLASGAHSPIPYAPTRITSNLGEIQNTNTEIRVEHLGTYQPATFKSTEAYHISNRLSGNESLKSKQQLWDQIDRQIERSKRMYQ